MPDASRRYPEVLTMVLCKMVIKDERTGMPSMVGVFSHIEAERFPFNLWPAAVFIELTDGQGEYAGCLRLVRARSEETVREIGFSVKLPDPLHVLQMQFDLPPIAIDREGPYRLDLLCEGELLRSRKFEAVQAKK